MYKNKKTLAAFITEAKSVVTRHFATRKAVIIYAVELTAPRGYTHHNDA
jgi:hypothetical protein